MEQVQFRGIDTTLDHDEGNNNALSRDEIARAGGDMAEKGNSDSDGSGNHREFSRQVHAHAGYAPKASREFRSAHHMFDIVLCYATHLGHQLANVHYCATYRLGAG